MHGCPPLNTSRGGGRAIVTPGARPIRCGYAGEGMRECAVQSVSCCALNAYGQEEQAFANHAAAVQIATYIIYLYHDDIMYNIMCLGRALVQNTKFYLLLQLPSQCDRNG